MFGIVAGMLRTLQHFVHPQPVTRKYPYEKRDLPERSRGLIALLLEPETSIFKCESCLMCEKACPPRAISISYTFKNSFRKRPPLAPRASYYRIRMVQTAPYGDRRPMSTAVTACGQALLDGRECSAALSGPQGGRSALARAVAREPDDRRDHRAERPARPRRGWLTVRREAGGGSPQREGRRRAPRGERVRS